MRSEDDAVDTLRRAHRDASDQLDDVPDARVRAAVLAAAARGADARPRLVTSASTTAPGAPASRTRRWPLSAAALLVVSVLTGLVATHGMRDRPERVTTIAAVTPSKPAPPVSEAAEPSRANGAPAPTPRTAPRLPLPAPPSPQPDLTRNEAQLDTRHAEVDRSPEPAPVPAPSTFVAPPPAAASAAPFREARAKTEPAADATSHDDEAGATPSLRAPAPSSATTAMRARTGRSAEPATPEAWVARIVRLRADGNDGEADRELESLRRRYPGFAIPADALASSGTR